MIFVKEFPLLVTGLSILESGDVQATENPYDLQLVGTIEADGEESPALSKTPGKPAATYRPAGCGIV